MGSLWHEDLIPKQDVDPMVFLVTALLKESLATHAILCALKGVMLSLRADVAIIPETLQESQQFYAMGAIL